MLHFMDDICMIKYQQPASERIQCTCRLDIGDFLSLGLQHNIDRCTCFGCRYILRKLDIIFVETMSLKLQHDKQI